MEALPTHVAIPHSQPDKVYFCSFEGCQMTFDRPSRLLWHSRVHTGERPYQCRISGCTRAYTTSTRLKRHEKKCKADQTNDDGKIGEGDESLKFKCKVEGCLKSFKRRQYLYNHEVACHKRSSEFVCEVEGCGKIFAFRQHLKRHTKTHQGYSCSQCQVVCEKWSDLRKHVSSEHKTGHKCEECSKMFSKPGQLRKHKPTHNTSTVQTFPCPEEGCDKSYNHVRNLRKHIQVQHHKEKPFKCSQCESAFPYKKSLEKHIAGHRKDDEDSEMMLFPKKGHRKVPLLDRLVGLKEDVVDNDAKQTSDCQLPQDIIPYTSVGTNNESSHSHQVAIAVPVNTA